MKKRIIITIIVVLLATICFASKFSGVYADIGVYICTSRDDLEDPIDFAIRGEFEKTRSVYIMFQRERLLGRYYSDYEVRFVQSFYLFTAYKKDIDEEGDIVLSKDQRSGISLRSRKKTRIKELKFFEMNFRTFSIQVRDIDIIHADARFSFYGYSVGIAQQWENKVPATKFIAGKYIYKDLNFFLLPARFELYTDTLTKDFKHFDTESGISLTFALSSLFAIRFSNMIKNYSKLQLLTMVSIRVNIG